MADQKSQKKEDEFSNEMLKKLAIRLRTVRKEKGYSNYEEFANKQNFNRVQYGRYEKGKNLQFNSLVRIIKSFGMTLKEFFNEGFDD